MRSFWKRRFRPPPVRRGEGVLSGDLGLVLMGRQWGPEVPDSPTPDPSSTQRWCHGCGRQSTSPRNSTVMAFPMRSLRSSKLWWVGREDGDFRYVQLPLNVFLFLPRIGVSVKQQFTEEEIYKDWDSQITAIEKTFEDAQKSVIEGLG